MGFNNSVAATPSFSLSLALILSFCFHVSYNAFFHLYAFDFMMMKCDYIRYLLLKKLLVYLIYLLSILIKNKLNKFNVTELKNHVLLIFMVLRLYECE